MQMLASSDFANALGQVVHGQRVDVRKRAPQQFSARISIEGARGCIGIDYGARFWIDEQLYGLVVLEHLAVSLLGKSQVRCACAHLPESMSQLAGKQKRHECPNGKPQQGAAHQGPYQLIVQALVRLEALAQ